MHVESSRSNFQAQKERTVTSVERIQGPYSSLHTQTKDQALKRPGHGLSTCSPLVPSSFEGSENVTPPTWQGQALFYCGSAHHVSLASEMTLCHLVRPIKEIMVQPWGWAGFVH